MAGVPKKSVSTPKWHRTDGTHSVWISKTIISSSPSTVKRHLLGKMILSRTRAKSASGPKLTAPLFSTTSATALRPIFILLTARNSTRKQERKALKEKATTMMTTGSETVAMKLLTLLSVVLAPHFVAVPGFSAELLNKVADIP